MTQDEIQALCKEERVFLHDIATPVGTVTFLVDAVLDMLKEHNDRSAEEIEQLELAQKALEQMSDLMRKRRSILIERGGK